MIDDQDKYWERGPGRKDENGMSFLDYLKRVKADPTRADELKGLVVLFGERTLERVIRGDLVITPRNFNPVKGER